MTQTITTSPAGLPLTVDGSACSAPCMFQWTPGTSHTLAASSLIAGGTGVQYVFSNWSDSGGVSHTITAPSSAATYTAAFNTQYYLTTAVNPPGGGTISPASGWYAAGAQAVISAQSTGYLFNGFSGGLSGTASPQTLTMNGPFSVTADFGSAQPGTQVRTFTWSGQDLVSTTNPENGTVTYTYDGAHHVTSRTDAKGQQTLYTYDTYGRVTDVRHYPVGWTDDGDPNQRWDYYYNVNPFDGGSYSTYTWGRLAAVQFGTLTGQPMQYMYSYNVAGRVTGQRLIAPLHDYLGFYPPAQIDASYAWDNEGRMTSQSYPVPAPLGTTDTLTLGYQFDSMGRLGTMTGDLGDGNGPLQLANATYGPAGELTGLTGGTPGSYYPYTETRTYNSLSQLTGINHSIYLQGSDVNIQYVYSTTQNNGRIVQSVDGVSGEQVTYQYDALNRLAHAKTASSAWGETYQYDRFGNLTAKTPTKGSAPALSAMYDASTNRQMGVGYDANGNQMVGTWDVENRLVSENGPDGTVQWLYDPWGKRVGKLTTRYDPNTNNNIDTVYEYTLYGITGQRLVTSVCSLMRIGGMALVARSMKNGNVFQRPPADVRHHGDRCRGGGPAGVGAERNPILAVCGRGREPDDGRRPGQVRDILPGLARPGLRGATLLRFHQRQVLDPGPADPERCGPEGSGQLESIRVRRRRPGEPQRSSGAGFVDVYWAMDDSEPPAGFLQRQWRPVARLPPGRGCRLDVPDFRSGSDSDAGVGNTSAVWPTPPFAVSSGGSGGGCAIRRGLLALCAQNI